MRLVGVSMMRDESDVIETFVRHHVQILDELVVVDHRSRDGTGEILASLAAEGLPLTVRAEPRFGHVQAARLGDEMRVAARRRDADAVLLLDGDEFLQSRDGGSVRAALEAEAPSDRYLRVPWRSYVPTAEDDAAEPDVLRRVRHRRRSEPQAWYKVLVPRRIAVSRRTRLPQGSHDVYRGRLKRSRRHPLAASDRLVLAHFPLRSVEQLERKVLQGWLACCALPPERRPQNAHWEMLYRALARGERIDAVRLEEAARCYPSLAAGAESAASAELVRDPVTPEKEPYALRHDALRHPAEPRALLASLAEELAQALGKRDARRGLLGRRPVSTAVAGSPRRRRAARRSAS